MTPKPKVCVCMAAYNAGRFLNATLASLGEQTLTNYELIVVDDGSTDNTWEIICDHSLKDQRIKASRNETNRGLVVTRNRCLNQCSAPLIAIADADDIFYPQRLSEQARFMEQHPEIGVLGTAVDYIDQNGCRQATGEDVYLTDSDIRFFLMLGPCIVNTTTMYRREALLGSGGYREGFDVGAEDYELWARLSSLTQFANLPTPLVAVRRHFGSITGRSDAYLAKLFLVASSLLSGYFGHAITDREARDLILLFWGGLRVDADCRPAVRLASALQSTGYKVETADTMRRFSQMLAEALWREARNRIYAQRRLSLALACRAIRIRPSLVAHPGFPKYIVRGMTPGFARVQIKRALQRRDCC